MYIPFPYLRVSTGLLHPGDPTHLEDGCISRHVRPTSDHQKLTGNHAQHKTLPEEVKTVYWWGV